MEASGGGGCYLMSHVCEGAGGGGGSKRSSVSPFTAAAVFPPWRRHISEAPLQSGEALSPVLSPIDRSAWPGS